MNPETFVSTVIQNAIDDLRAKSLHPGDAHTGEDIAQLTGALGVEFALKILLSDATKTGTAIVALMRKKEIHELLDEQFVRDAIKAKSMLVAVIEQDIRYLNLMIEMLDISDSSYKKSDIRAISDRILLKTMELGGALEAFLELARDKLIEFHRTHSAQQG